MAARRCKINLISQHHRIGLTLMDLVAIFMDEACTVCRNKSIARNVALESLRDYIKKNVSNVKIIVRKR
jgi:thioredoxin-related protein